MSTTRVRSSREPYSLLDPTLIGLCSGCGCPLWASDDRTIVTGVAVAPFACSDECSSAIKPRIAYLMADEVVRQERDDRMMRAGGKWA